MVKPINKKLILLLIILSLGLYLLYNPIEHLDKQNDTETNISILTQILQSEIKDLTKRLDEQGEDILELKLSNRDNTTNINKIQAEIDSAEDIMNEAN